MQPHGTPVSVGRFGDGKGTGEAGTEKSGNRPTVFRPLYRQGKGYLIRTAVFKADSGDGEGAGRKPEPAERIIPYARHSTEQESDVRTFIREIRRYATIQELDETILNRLISRILVGEVRKVDGEKFQEVKIIYNFVGEIPAGTE